MGNKRARATSEHADSGTQPGGLDNAEAVAEQLQLLQALQRAHWNRRSAAQLLNMSYGSLLAKLRKHAINPPPGQQS